MPLGERCCRVKTFNQDDKNCSTVNYYQCGRATVLKCCMSELLVQLLDEPVFNALRTREQLGYDVTCQRRTTYNTLGFLISVSGGPCPMALALALAPQGAIGCHVTYPCCLGSY